MCDACSEQLVLICKRFDRNFPMKNVVLILAALVLADAGAALAHDYKLGPIAIGHPWARPTAQGAKNAAAYLTLQNGAGEPDRLVAVNSPVAEKAQIHETSNDGGIMKMREAADGVTLAPGESVAFKPGGYHIMLVGLKNKLDDGQHIPLTLTFAKAGSINVEVYVEKASGQGGGTAPSHDMHGMDHGSH
jgi:periplasmic copper chaperone A